MRHRRARRSFAAAAAAVTLVVAGPAAQAAIVVPSGGTGVESFDAVPPADRYSTTPAATLGTGGGPINTEDLLDAGVQTLSIADLSAALPTSATDPPSTNQAARFNTTNLYLQTRPTGNGATLLLATLQNAAGAAASSLSIRYTLSQASAPAETEQIPGHRVYYSATGAAGGWTPVGTFAAAGPVVVNIPIAGNWAAGAPLYVLWADDNMDPGTDGSNHIDDISYTPTVVPEPASAIVLGAVGLGLLVRRRRRRRA